MKNYLKRTSIIGAVVTALMLSGSAPAHAQYSDIVEFSRQWGQNFVKSCVRTTVKNSPKSAQGLSMSDDAAEKQCQCLSPRYLAYVETQSRANPDKVLIDIFGELLHKDDVLIEISNNCVMEILNEGK